MTREHLYRALSRGPCSAPELQQVLSVSKSTLQRLLQSERDDLLTTGRARATKYAARRSIEGVMTPIPIYEVGPEGTRHAMTLHPVEPFGFYVEGHLPEVGSGFVSTRMDDPELPWFLADARPHGFLGRAWARGHEAQGFPRDVDRWTADHVLRFMTHYGTDLGGALIAGTFARDLVERMAPPPVVREQYPQRAIDALNEVPWGSSPGGEQPKFVVAGHIVKFSPKMDEPSGRRWADLLAAEHLAHEVLRAHGVEAARSVVFDDGGRRFLEIERFDRHGARGRVGMVSLSALDPSGISHETRSWSIGVTPLVREGLLSAEDLTQVGWLEAFGHLIANSDMHPGNLSFRMRGTTLQGLAPVYDMLPMFFAPRGGELPSEIYPPLAQRETFPTSAIDAARALWEQISDSAEISGDFKRIADIQRGLLPAHGRGY